MNTAEPRICPSEGCGRLLIHSDGKYLCHNCWLVLSKEEALPHPSLSGLCVFKVSECEAGKWYSCFTCGKSIMLTNEEVARWENWIKTFLEEAPKKRQEYLEWKEKVAEECKKKEERDSFVKKIMSMSQRELKEADLL